MEVDADVPHFDVPVRSVHHHLKAIGCCQGLKRTTVTAVFLVIDELDAVHRRSMPSTVARWEGTIVFSIQGTTRSMSSTSRMSSFSSGYKALLMPWSLSDHGASAQQRKPVE